MTDGHWWWITVHNQVTGEGWKTLQFRSQSNEQAAEEAVVWAFRELGWHHVLCDPVADVEEVAI